MFKHATLSAWQREHEGGGYKAEIEGWMLEVKWHPEGPGKRRGFSWTAKQEGKGKLAGGQGEPIEEIENAMVAAEDAAKQGHKAGMPEAPEGGGDAAPASAEEVREANEG